MFTGFIAGRTAAAGGGRRSFLRRPITIPSMTIPTVTLPASTVRSLPARAGRCVCRPRRSHRRLRRRRDVPGVRLPLLRRPWSSAQVGVEQWRRKRRGIEQRRLHRGSGQSFGARRPLRARGREHARRARVSAGPATGSPRAGRKRQRAHEAHFVLRKPTLVEFVVVQVAQLPPHRALSRTGSARGQSRRAPRTNRRRPRSRRARTGSWPGAPAAERSPSLASWSSTTQAKERSRAGRRANVAREPPAWPAGVDSDQFAGRKSRSS